MSTSDEARAEYTPTTEEVREGWGHYRISYDWFKNENMGRGEKALADEFDRWLAAHDAEVLAAAQRPPVSPEVLNEVWAALGCERNPEDFREGVRATMWAQALDMIRESTARDSRVYRENQALSAEVQHLRECPQVGPEVREALIDTAARRWAASAPSTTASFDDMSQHRQYLLLTWMGGVIDAILARFSLPTRRHASTSPSSDTDRSNP